MVFLILNFDTQLGRNQIVDNDHDKFVERFSRRCNRSTMTSSQRNDESERLLEPQLVHKLEIKFAVQGEVI